MSNKTAGPDQVDVRGPRFTAWVTTAVIVATLIVSAFSPIAAAVILGLQTVVFAIGAVGGPRKHPYGRIFAAFVAPRLGPVTEREPVPPLQVRAAGRIPVRGRRHHRIRRRVDHCSDSSLTAFALFAAFLNAAFGICLGCQLYPLVARLRRGTRNRLTPETEVPERISYMARSDVLVSADWAESNLDAPNTVFVEVDEDTSAYDTGHIAGAVKLDWKTDLQDPVKRDFVDAAAVLQAAVRQAASPMTTP